MSIENKRSQICGMSFIPMTDATVVNHPGESIIKISGTWHEISISSGEFKEKEGNGDVVEQELEAVVTDTGENAVALLRNICRCDGLIRLRHTNGDIKVVGTDQFPVLLTMQRSGTPASITLSFKRKSPEPAKILESF